MHIKSQNSKNKFNAISYPFIILPAFGQTIWFKLVILILLIVGIYIYLKWKTKTSTPKTSTRRPKMLEEIIDERTKEIILETKRSRETKRSH